MTGPTKPPAEWQKEPPTAPGWYRVANKVYGKWHVQCYCLDGKFTPCSELYDHRPIEFLPVPKP